MSYRYEVLTSQHLDVFHVFQSFYATILSLSHTAAQRYYLNSRYSSNQSDEMFYLLAFLSLHRFHLALSKYRRNNKCVALLVFSNVTLFKINNLISEGSPLQIFFFKFS